MSLLVQPEIAGGELDNYSNQFCLLCEPWGTRQALMRLSLGAGYVPRLTCMHITSIRAKVVAEERCVLGDAALQHSASDEPTGAA